MFRFSKLQKLYIVISAALFIALPASIIFADPGQTPGGSQDFDRGSVYKVNQHSSNVTSKVIDKKSTEGTYNLGEYSLKESSIKLLGPSKTLQNYNPKVPCTNLMGVEKNGHRCEVDYSEMDNVTLTAKCDGGQGSFDNGMGGWKITVTPEDFSCPTTADYYDVSGTLYTADIILDSNIRNGQYMVHTASECPDSSGMTICVHKTDTSSSGIDVSGVDDMIRVEPSGRGLIEHKEIAEEEKRLLWIDNQYGSPVMVPPGPFVNASGKDPYDDFINFRDNAPASLNVEKGCYPIDITLCPNVRVEVVPVPGQCGIASGATQGTYADLAAVQALPDVDLCTAGNAPADRTTGITLAGNQVQWTCEGINGAAGDACSYQLPNLCGPADGNTYDTNLELTAAGLCDATYSYSNLVSTGTQWTWTCTDGSTGATQSCAANQNPAACSPIPLQHSLLIIQDLSGTFSNDLPNVVTQLDSLFSNPVFANWEVALTSFRDNIGGDFTSGFSFKRRSTRMDLDWTPVAGAGKTSILNTIASYTTEVTSENAFFAIDRSIALLHPNSSGLDTTVILITDEGPEDFSISEGLSDYTSPDAKNQENDALSTLLSTNSRFIALTTDPIYGNPSTNTFRNALPERNYWDDFTDHINKDQSENRATRVDIATDSSNLEQAIIDGLINTSKDCTPVGFTPPPPVDGVCGNAHGNSAAAAPTSDLCVSGIASPVSGSGPWFWQCSGSGPGTSNDNCFADPEVGRCGPADGGTYFSHTPPSNANLCSEGTPDGNVRISNSGNAFVWTCQGASDDNCTAIRIHRCSSSPGTAFIRSQCGLTSAEFPPVNVFPTSSALGATYTTLGVTIRCEGIGAPNEQHEGWRVTACP